MRVDKKKYAVRLNTMLRMFGKFQTDIEELIDTIFYHFARLHGIGVAVSEGESDNSYIFMKYPNRVESFWHPFEEGGQEEATCKSTSMTILKRQIEHTRVDQIEYILNFVERRFNLPHWKSYIEGMSYDEWKRQNWLLLNSLYGIPKKHDDTLDAFSYAVRQQMRNGGLYPVDTINPTATFKRVLENMDVASMYPTLAGKGNVLKYCEEDVRTTMDYYRRLSEHKKNTIKKVIFHDPATIIYWEDGTKTVVKVQNGEKFDPEKGMAMAICKKTHGNDGSYYEAFKKFLPKEEKKAFEFSFDLQEGVDEPTEDNIETPIDLEESTDTVTIDTEAEQYTGENPKEISDCGININTALAAFVEDIGCLEALYDPERGMYYIRDKNHFEKAPYALAVDSPIAEISPTALAQLKLDICKCFDI